MCIRDRPYTVTHTHTHAHTQSLLMVYSIVLSLERKIREANPSKHDALLAERETKKFVFIKNFSFKYYKLQY